MYVLVLGQTKVIIDHLHIFEFDSKIIRFITFFHFMESSMKITYVLVLS